MFDLSLEVLLTVGTLLLVANLACLLLLYRGLLDARGDSNVQRLMTREAVDALNAIRADTAQARESLSRLIEVQEVSVRLLAQIAPPPPQQHYEDYSLPREPAPPAPPGYVDRTSELLGSDHTRETPSQ